MSKAKLKKELAEMSHEQLMEIILNLYSARKEAKEYFEFFLNPDSDAMLDKMRDKIIKEMTRTHRGARTKFRISVIKNTIKDFEGLDPGPEYVLELMLFSLNAVMAYSMKYFYSDTQYNSAGSLALLALDYADKHNMFDKALQAIEQILKSTSSEPYIRDCVRRALASR